MTKLACFKAYDIRGKIGDELNEDVAYRIGRAYGEIFKPKRVVVGADIRTTSGTPHRLENPGKIPLEIVEIQSGSYLGEDDIIRMEDVYGRDSA